MDYRVCMRSTLLMPGLAPIVGPGLFGHIYWHVQCRALMGRYRLLDCFFASDPAWGMCLMTWYFFSLSKLYSIRAYTLYKPVNLVLWLLSLLWSGEPGNCDPLTQQCAPPIRRNVSPPTGAALRMTDGSRPCDMANLNMQNTILQSLGLLKFF